MRLAIASVVTEIEQTAVTQSELPKGFSYDSVYRPFAADLAAQIGSGVDFAYPCIDQLHPRSGVYQLPGALEDTCKTGIRQSLRSSQPSRVLVLMLRGYNDIYLAILGRPTSLYRLLDRSHHAHLARR